MIYRIVTPFIASITNNITLSFIIKAITTTTTNTKCNTANKYNNTSLYTILIVGSMYIAAGLVDIGTTTDNDNEIVNACEAVNNLDVAGDIILIVNLSLSIVYR